MKAHYAGSIAYDNSRDEWEDELVIAFSFDGFVEDMKAVMDKRKNSEVFFACYKNQQGKERDITQQVREELG